MRVRSVIIATLISMLLAACATPMQYTGAQMTNYDRDTEYAVEPRPDGFAITISYSRYQFIPESSAVAGACKSALTAIAHEHAEKQGRKVEPIDEQRIRISTGRNIVTGITSCSASAIAVWQK